jgi:hypothetical protein
MEAKQSLCKEHLSGIMPVKTGIQEIGRELPLLIRSYFPPSRYPARFTMLIQLS